MLRIIVLVIISAIASLMAVNWIYFKILRIAKEKNIVDNPDARKLQKTPVPILGGLAVFFGMVVGVFVGITSQAVLFSSQSGIVMVPICAMILMLFIGFVDDTVGLSPTIRLIIEVITMLGMIYGAGACIDTFHGVWGIEAFSWRIGVPLTVFIGVGIINSINMVDGVNGLSSGLCMVYSLLFGVVFLRTHDRSNAILAFSMAFALVPFFLHNVFGKRSRMFIGDAGTMIMGVLLTWFTICMLHSHYNILYYAYTVKVNVIALALAIMSVPVADTLRVMSQRMIKGQSPFSPDKTHLHHAFIRAGISHFVTTLCEILINLTVVAVWGFSVLLNADIELQLYLVIVVGIVLVWGTYLFLEYNIRHHTKLMHKLAHASTMTHFEQKAWWRRLQQKLDQPELSATGNMNETQTTEHLVRRFGHQDISSDRNVDVQKVYDYLRGKAEVHVADIIRRSGANPNSVQDIIAEGAKDGTIKVLLRNKNGAATIVCID